MLADQGKELEKEVYKLFPETVRVQSKGMDALAETKALISQGHRYIAQAAFATTDFFVQADLVHFKENGTVDIYEIKSSSTMQNMGLDKDHVTDLAFQYNVIMAAGYTVESVFLIELNKDYRRRGDLNLQQLFAINNVTDKVITRAATLQIEMQEALIALHSSEEPITCNCKYLARKKQCPAFAYLHPELMDYAVYDLTRIGSSPKRLLQLVNEGIYQINEIPDHYDLLDAHRDQVYTWNHNTPIIHIDKIAAELNRLIFPLYFLDYETTSTAIPLYEGMKPYEHVPFQYSLHILPAKGEELIHAGYIHRDQTNPIPELSRHLRKHIDDTGTVIVWNKSFESKCNQNMAKSEPTLLHFLLGLNARIFDLMEIFSKRLYVHKDFRGSYSIKKVLPVLVPELSYKDLAIADGGTATTEWRRMVREIAVVGGDTSTSLSTGNSSQRPEEIYQQLWEYCKLDTLAMVEIYKKLQQGGR